MIRINFWISYLIVVVISLLGNPLLFAKNTSKDTLTSGLEHYKSKDYSLALIDWHTLLQNKKYAESPEVLYNLALTEFKLEDYGASIGHLRKSQALNPLSFKTQKTIKLVSKTIEDKAYYRIDQEPLLYIVINWLPKTIFIGVFFMILGCGTVIGLRQKQQGTLFWPFFKVYFFFLLASLIPLTGLFWQSQIHEQTYATLTGAKPVALLTSQDSKAPEVGTLNVGDSFRIIGFSKDVVSKDTLTGDTSTTDDLLKETASNESDWVAVSTENVPLGWINTKDYIVYRGKIDQ